MVDTKQAMESEFLTVDNVKSNNEKAVVVLDGGDYEESNYGKRLTVLVSHCGNIKKWRPNKKSVENLQTLGSDTDQWVGKKVQVGIESINGKFAIIAQPAAEGSA